jgi:hypothetical protein
MINILLIFLGIGFEIVSYSTNIRICSTADSSLFSQSELDGWNEAIYGELDALLKAMSL